MSSALKSTTVEIANGNTRSVHNNGVMGFLKSDGNWDMYANNSGQIWAANYGWLHDYFFSGISNTTTNQGNCVASGNLSANCVVVDASLTDGGSVVTLNRYYKGIAYNCNCACK